MRILVFCGTREALRFYGMQKDWRAVFGDTRKDEKQDALNWFKNTEEPKLAVDESFIRGWHTPPNTRVLFDSSWIYGPGTPEWTQAVRRAAIERQGTTEYYRIHNGRFSDMSGKPFGIDISTSEDNTSVSFIQSNKVLLSLDRERLNKQDPFWAFERNVLAHAFTKLADIHKAEVYRTDSSYGVYLEISLNGVGVSICLDMSNPCDTPMMHWHNVRYPGRAFTAAFCAQAGVDVAAPNSENQLGRGKGWFDLAMKLNQGLCMAARGEALTS